jgi:hypothetical protein
MRVASFLYRRSDLEPTLVPPAAGTYVGVHALGGDCYSITRPGPLFVRPVSLALFLLFGWVRRATGRG